MLTEHFVEIIQVSFYFVYIIAVIYHHAEFIAGTPCRQAVLRRHFQHNCTKILEILIAGVMSICVVDGFKTVQIEHYHCTYFAGRHCVQGLGSQMFEMVVFKQAGQWIMGIFILHPFFLEHVSGDIRYDAEAAVLGFRHVNTDVFGIAELVDICFSLHRGCGDGTDILVKLCGILTEFRRLLFGQIQ